jgi:hypothetical protein
MLKHVCQILGIDRVLARDTEFHYAINNSLERDCEEERSQESEQLKFRYADGETNLRLVGQVSKQGIYFKINTRTVYRLFNKRESKSKI